MRDPQNNTILLLPLQEFMSFTFVQGKLHASILCSIFYIDSLRTAFWLQVPYKPSTVTRCVIFFAYD
ncbi:hypothetical protein BHM03_00062510 [Ensete ventricosum]|nr:hypothetical protein BHM03_00062510 [Ensete ventricosum]